jgi:hypothetical protein
MLRPLTFQINLTRGPGLELLHLNPLVYAHNYVLVPVLCVENPLNLQFSYNLAHEPCFSHIFSVFYPF